MSDNIKLDSPTPGFLKQLAGMIPGFIRDVTEGRMQNKGRKLPVPRRMCTICGSQFDRGVIHTGQVGMIPDYCPQCKGLLQQGFTACVCDRRYAFLRSEAMKPVAGTVIAVDKETMDAIQKKKRGETETENEKKQEPA